MSKHTPGPWEAHGRGGFSDGGSKASHPHFDGRIVAPSGTAIVSTSNFLGVMGHTPEEAEANARLIAAAPELLEACKVVMAYLDKLEFGIEDNDPLQELRQQCHAPLRAALEPAIAKAEGK